MSTASNPTVLERIGSARNAFANLEHWLYSHTSDTHKLHTIEVEQERRGREVLRLMLQNAGYAVRPRPSIQGAHTGAPGEC